jgi:hypothetical protein
MTRSAFARRMAPRRDFWRDQQRAMIGRTEEVRVEGASDETEQRLAGFSPHRPVG